MQKGDLEMRVLVLNGSPAGKDSITLQTVHFIGKHYTNTVFEILHAAQQIRTYERDFSKAEEALRRADLILFCYPVYTFLVPSQLHRFIELIKEHGMDLSGKYATQLSTSKHFYDTTAHRFIQDSCDDLGLRYVRGLSADMEDLLAKKGQREALAFFRYVRWCMKNRIYETPNYARIPLEGKTPGAAKRMEEQAAEDQVAESQTGKGQGTESQAGENRHEDPGNMEPEKNAESHTAESGTGRIDHKAACRRIAIVADLPEHESGARPQDGESCAKLQEMVDAFSMMSSFPCDVINIRTFPMKGGCLGCFHCAADGTCVYTDGFDRMLRERIQDADAVVYAYTIDGHSMGSRFKMFDDRQFCNGHRTVTMGKPVGYLINGKLSVETNLQTVMEARGQVGGNFLAGTACNETDAEETGRQIWQLVQSLEYAIRNDYNPPANFYGVGGMKIFRDLIYQMQGLMREDHRFYKEHGFYDFPQKNKGKVAGMYLVGAMMNSEKLKKKLGGRMTEGMLMPYRSLLKRVEKKQKRQEQE